MKYIFLDFDGVLHRTYDSTLFEYMDDFCHAVRPYSKNTRIVISSMWRQNHSLDHLKSYFEKDISPIVIGITPTLPSILPYQRFREIEYYCHKNNVKEWCALDDMETLFPPDCEKLIYVENGLAENNLKDLVKFLQ